MQTPSFDSLAIELIAHGYLPVFFTELYCSSCGGYRSAVTQCDEKMPCPKCQALRPAATVARGFTKHVSGVWERWESPLTAPCRHSLLVEEGDEAAHAARERIRQKEGRERSHHYKVEKIDPADFEWNEQYA